MSEGGASDDERPLRASEPSQLGRPCPHPLGFTRVRRGRLHRRSDVPYAVVEFDRTEVGEVAGKTLLHLQCHFGRDTLSWARLGAEVTGLDFSEAAIAAARRLSDESGTPGRFLVADLYESPNVLAEQFDFVYTSVGALNWLPDIGRWGQVVAGFVKPGGTFYVRDSHPVMWSLDAERTDGLLAIEHPYFETAEPLRWGDPRSYAGDGVVDASVTYEWNHGLGETVTALVEAGLTIEFLREHQFVDWEGTPSLEETEPNRWRLTDRPARLPLTFSIRARRER
ncbi:MAG: class I SAM-dependent methyltransferase [Chloroflexi bacterium]|nr:class I SAM-dependent methyltransferase [Chloroflexota bacterium]